MPLTLVPWVPTLLIKHLRSLLSVWDTRVQCEAGGYGQQGPHRRLRNISTSLPWEVNVEILTKFSNGLRISGYNANFRAKVIQSAIKGFRRQVEAAANALWGMIRRSKIS